ncbi:MAG: hypothetical protein ACQEST_10875, partial [Bacteroidota bacterium]
DKTFYQVLPRSPDDLNVANLQPIVEEGAFIYADIDTTSETIYMLLKSGLWAYNLSNESWRFLNALDDLKGSFSSYEFGFNDQTNMIQLWSRGMGKLFNVDPKTYEIESQNHSSEHQNQFGHFPFYRDSTLYAFGGYGYWNYHNMMVHFDHSQNEWSLQDVSSASEYPSRRVPTTGTYDQKQDQLYIYGGWGAESGYPKDQHSQSQEFWDIWSFSFESRKWEKMMTLEQLPNKTDSHMPPSQIGRTNKHSSSLYLPDEQLWFIPTVNSNPQDHTFRFRAVHLPQYKAMGLLSPLGDSNTFIPTNYFYIPNEDEIVFVGIDNLANTDSYPVGIHRIPADSLVAKISSDSPFYLTANLYNYLIGLTVLGGILFWFYRKRINGGHTEEQEIEPLSYYTLIKVDWYNKRQKKLLKHMHKENQFMDTQQIEELLWSDVESYDYRRRLRNDIIKDINRKFKNHYPGLGDIILRKKDPNDNRRYLYGLNTQLMGE